MQSPGLSQHIKNTVKDSKYKNILFDLDGTLTNPRKGITNSYLYSLNKLNLREDNPDSIASFIGLPLHSYFEVVHKLKGELIDVAVKLYREYYSVTGQYENVLYDGIPEMLDLLALQKKTLFLVTSKPAVYAESILDFFKIRKFFRNIYGSDLSSYNKSKTELIKILIESEKLNPDECVMIGDRNQDIIGAKDNKIDSIAVTYGFGSIEELEGSNPEWIAKTVADLNHILTN
jgi:phosphoglycolate phosphatase